MNIVKLRSSLLLLLTAIVWGMGFVSQSAGSDSMGAFTFTSVRNILACVALIPVIAVIRARTPAEKKKPIDKKITIKAGVCCGFALTAASLFQQFGVSMTTVGKSGFITALYIIFTPILGIFIKKKCPKIVWLGAAMAAFGMYLLCMTSDSFSLQTGDLLVLICAVLYAVHILIIDYFSPKTDGVVVACIQFFVCFLVSGVLALIFEQPTWKQITDGAIPLLYAGLMSSGVGYTLQIVGQKGLNPTVAALIMSLESVTSAVAGFIAYKIGFLTTDQSLSARQICGCAIVFCAVILVQIPWENIFKKRKKG